MKYLREAGSEYFVAVVVLLLVDVFEVNFPFLYPLKSSENLYFFDLLRRLTWNGWSKEELNRQARDLTPTFFICKTHQHWRSSTSIVFSKSTCSFDNIWNYSCLYQWVPKNWAKTVISKYVSNNYTLREETFEENILAEFVFGYYKVKYHEIFLSGTN